MMKGALREQRFGYLLREIRLDDAAFIVETRLEDAARNCYIHKISPDIKAQESWLQGYFKRQNDYYFVIENALNGQKEGLIAIYNVKDKRAEFGRWVIKKGSLASVESVNLLYKIAFEKLRLDELYTRTVEDNTQVVEFHKSVGAKFRAVLQNEFEIEGRKFNAVEQFVSKESYFGEIKENLDAKSLKIFRRNLRQVLGKFEFHHLGIATKNIEKEFKSYALLGYEKETKFTDELQGVKGQFIIAKNQPRLELLENLENSNTLNFFLKNGIKVYHFGFFVGDICAALEIFTKCLKAKIVSSPKISAYFKSQICFVALSNLMILELIESKSKEGDNNG